MYRAVTLKVIQKGVREHHKSKVNELLDRTNVTLQQDGHSVLVLLDGKDVSDFIRTPEIDVEIGWVCQIPEVRDRMTTLQREIGRKGNIVAEGRDMGTVVFPDANLKFYLIASIKERGRRRWKQLQKDGINISLDDVCEDIQRRDTIDSQRELSPLTKAEDAIEIDTSDLTIEQQTDMIVQYVREYKQH